MLRGAGGKKKEKNGAARLPLQEKKTKSPTLSDLSRKH